MGQRRRKRHRRLRDAYFRSMMGIPEVAHEFLTTRLPSNVLSGFKIDHIEMLPTAILTGGLKNSTPDLLFKLRSDTQAQMYVIMVIEHQSVADRFMPIRLWGYQADVLRHHLKSQHSKRDRLKRLPAVLACVYYTGQRQPYPYSLDLHSLFDPGVASQQMFAQPYALKNLGALSDQEILSNAHLGLVEYAIHCTEHQRYESLIDGIVALHQQSGLRVDIREQTWHYIYHELDEAHEDFFEQLSEQLPDFQGEIMSYAESLILKGKSMGRAEGERVGLEQGQQTSRRAIALEMLAAQLSIDIIARCTGLTHQAIMALSNEGELGEK